MKTLWLFVFALLGWSCFGQTSIQFNLSVGNQNIAPFTNVEVILQQVGINQSATVTFLGEPIYQFTDTNGITTFSNLQTSAGNQPSYWNWTVPANSTPNGPANTYRGYVVVGNTNLGTISSTLCSVVSVPTATGLGWAYSAQTSDLRYSASTNSLANYALIGNLNTASNALYAQIVSATNGQTSIVYSNPAAYSTPSGVTNIVLALAQTNTPPSLATITNIANAAANAIGLNGTNYATGATNIAVANLTTAIIGTNNALVAALNASNVTQNANLISASNSIAGRFQAGSIILSNAAVNGIFTNFLAAGQNMNFTTNISGTIVTLNATNPATLMNGTTATNSFQGTNANLSLWAALSTNVLNGVLTTSATNGLPTTAQVTNIASGVYSNNPAGYLTAVATNLFITGTVATNSFDTNGAARAAIASLAYQPSNNYLTLASATGINTNNYMAGQNMSITTNISGTIQFLNATNQTFLLSSYATTNQNNAWYDTNGAANAAATSALKTATNAFDATNTAAVAALAALKTATNSFDPTNQALLVYNANPAHYIGIVGAGNLINASISNLVPQMITTAGIAYTNAFDVTNAAARAYTNAIITASNFFFVKLSGGNISNYFGVGTKTNWLVSTNVINIYGVPGLPVLGDYVGLPGGTLWTNLNNLAETIQYATPNFFLFTNYGSILLYQSPDAVNWLVAGSGSGPAPIGAYGLKWRIGGIVDGYLNSTDLTAQIARYVATNSGGTVSTNGSTNFLLGANPASVVGGFTTNNNFTTAGSNTIIAIVIANATNPTNGITLTQATNVVTGMTNITATLGFVTNYVQAVTNTVTSQYTEAINNATSSIVTLIASGLPYIANNSGLGTNETLLQRTTIGKGHQYALGTGDPNNIAQQTLFAGGQTNTLWTRDDAHGGFQNVAIVGGTSNTISQFDWQVKNSVIAGGSFNTNDSADNTFVAGQNGTVTHHNTFLWNDGPTLFASSQTNTFVVHAMNGVGINTNKNGTYALNVHGTVQSDVGFYVNGVLVSGSGGGGSATNAIGLLNGFGTNTTLIGSNYINAIAFYTVPNTNIANIPIMTSDSLPSGTVTSSSQNDSVGHPDWAAFGYPSAGDWQSFTEYDQWIQYQFAYPVSANAFQLQINGGTVTQPFALQTSSDGSNWFNVFFNGSQTWVIGSLVTNSFPLTTSAYWRWNFYNTGNSIADISHIQLYQVPVNVVDAGTNLPIQVNSPMAVNTSTITNGSWLEVNGNSDMKGLSINGQPIQSLIMQYIQSLSINGLSPTFANSYTVTGGVSNSPSSYSSTFNGAYTLWINPPPNQPVYLNSIGEKFGQVIVWGANGWPVGIPTNVYAIFNFNRGQFYTNSVANNPVGTYMAYGSTVPTNSMTVSVTGALTYLQSGSSSPFDGGALTNLGISSQLPSYVLTNFQTTDGHFSGGLNVSKGLSDNITNRTDGFIINPILPGYAGTPFKLIDTNGTIRGTVDSNFVANLNGAGITNLNASNLASGTVPISRLSIPQLAAQGVVTNGSSTAKFGLNYATGMWGTNATTGAGGTNDFYIINAINQPTLNLTHYHWSQAFGAYTNYAGTNNLPKMWFDSSNLGFWIIGTNVTFTDDGSKSLEYYNGANIFPTNDAGNWFTNEVIPYGQEIMMDLVTTITTSNNYTITLSTNGAWGTTVNPYNFYPSAQDGIVDLVSVPWTNGVPRPILSVGQEDPPSSLVPRLMLHCYYVPTNSPLVMANSFRFNSIVDGVGGGDNRGLILKGESDVNLLGYSVYMIETHAGPGAPGTHGVFLNPFKICTNGVTAIGNLTDVADDGNNTLKPPAWLSLYGDGSAWSGGSSTIPSFAILSKALVAAPVASAEENDGTYRYWTDNGNTRRKYVVEGLANNGSGLTNGFANATTYTNFVLGTTYTNTTTRSAFVSANAQCSPTTVTTARFALATSPTGATFTTNAAVGLDADTIFTTVPHGWYQATAIVPPGGIWKVVDITGGGAVMVTNSYWQTLQ